MESRRWLDYAHDGGFTCTSAANVRIYPESHELTIGGMHVHCTHSQFCLLSTLLENFCRTVSYERLGFGKRQASANLLAVQICYLRRLLRVNRAELVIRNVYGKGYQARPAR